MGALQRYDNAPYLQVSSARNMQAAAYRGGDIGGNNKGGNENGSNSAKCLITLHHNDAKPNSKSQPRESNSLTTLWETYEPVNGISNYKMIERIEFGGVCVAKEECAKNPRCHGFLYLLRDGLSFLFTLKEQQEIVINTQGMR